MPKPDIISLLLVVSGGPKIDFSVLESGLSFVGLLGNFKICKLQIANCSVLECDHIFPFFSFETKWTPKKL
jgi:hypothetical protein